MKKNNEEFVEFSEFTYWWNDYDFEKYNWTRNDNEQNAKRAFELIEEEFDDEISFDYDRIASSLHRLYLLDVDESVYL